MLKCAVLCFALSIACPAEQITLTFKDVVDRSGEDCSGGGCFLGDFYNGGPGGDYGIVGYTEDLRYVGNVVRDAIVQGGSLTFTHLTNSLYVKGGFEGSITFQYNTHIGNPYATNGVILLYKGQIIASTGLPETQVDLFDTHTLSFKGMADTIKFGMAPDGNNLRGYAYEIRFPSISFSNLHMPYEQVSSDPPRRAPVQAASYMFANPGPPVLLYRSGPSQMKPIKPTSRRAGDR